MDLPGLLGSLAPFTTILYTFPINPDHLGVLEACGRENQTPLIAVHSVGYYSYFNVTYPGPFPIVETHPETTATTDLRLLDPWEELSDFAAEMTKNIDTLDNHEHGHLPFVVILLHYLQEWKASHGNAPPKTYAEKVAFRKIVTEAARTDSPEGGEENFDEAVAAVLKTILPPSLPSDVREVFEHEHTESNVSGSC